MPEGHTLHRLALDHTRDLRNLLVQVSSPQGRFECAALVDGTKFLRAEAHGKHLFHRYAGARVVHIHLGLFGKFRRHPGREPIPRETVRMRIVRASPLLTLDLTGPTACGLLTRAEERALRARLGEDPLQPDADPGRVWEKLRKRKGPLGVALMDQSLIAGVGNVYRAEALFVHRLHPLLPSNALTRPQFDALWSWLVEALARGVRDRTIITVPAAMDRPRFRLPRSERVHVYKAEACPSCSGPVRRWDLAGRWAYACERCQPL